MKLLAFLLALATVAYGHDKIVGCYWGVWSFYRPGYGAFDVDDIDASLCTHGMYGFADLDNATWTIKVWDPWYDQAPEDCGPDGSIYCHYDSYRRFINLKQSYPNFKPMISIGGWNAGSGSYSMMAADPQKRKTFIDSLSEFLDKYHFDGVDLDWEYPGDREGSDPENDKENFSKLVTEMKAMLSAKGKLFTAALTPDFRRLDIGYDVPVVSEALDVMFIMTYDYHGLWDNHNFTGHNAPIYFRDEENFEEHPGYKWNVYDTLNIWMDRGAPKDKMVMGIPAYGRGFTLDDPALDGLYCPANEGIPAGPYTRQKAFWGYQEILQAQNNDTLINLPGATPHDWKVVVDDCYKAPYMVNGPYWIGYADEESVANKVRYANLLDIAGVMVWSIDTDNFRGEWNQKKFPLLHSIQDTLNSGETLDPSNPKCSGTAPMCDVEPSTTTTTTTTTIPVTSPTTSSPFDPSQCTEVNDVIPYPGDCHRYLMCLDNGQGGYNLQVYTCGDWVFDPNIDACTDPGLPSNDILCE